MPFTGCSISFDKATSGSGRWIVASARIGRSVELRSAGSTRRAMDNTGAVSLSLDRNLALIAGAGSGKTHSLVTICLQLLAGARPGGNALRPSQLLMVTFTEKAAAEMRERLLHRLLAASLK